MTRRTDKTLLILTALFVAGLAIVAGAISFDHMRALATHHDQLGWKSYAFPISVDGLEIVASLYLVAQRRAGRSTGWIPWTALLVGTVASLSANIAVGGADPVGKALAGWPALSMLASVKLLFSMFDHGADDQQADVRDRPGRPLHRPCDGTTGLELVRCPPQPAGGRRLAVPARQPGGRVRATRGRGRRHTNRGAPRPGGAHGPRDAGQGWPVTVTRQPRRRNARRRTRRIKCSRFVAPEDSQGGAGCQDGSRA